MTSTAATNASPPQPGPRVVVVGGGFAGIAAAAALRQGGVSDVVVLEAQDHPGGRVQKIKLDNGFIEPGAQFIHGEKGNQLFQLAQKYGLLMDKSLYQCGKKSDSSAEDYKDNQFFNSRGELVRHESATHLIHTLNKLFRDYANSFFHDTEQGGAGSEEADQPGVVPDDNCVTSGPKVTTNGTTARQKRTLLEHNGASSHNGADGNHGGTTSQTGGDGNLNGTTSQNGGGQNTSGTMVVLNYRNAAGFDDNGKRQNTFVELLKKAREKLLAVGDEPEELKIAIFKWVQQWEYTDNAARLEDVSLQAYGKFAYIEGYGMTLTVSGLHDVLRAFLDQSLPPHSLLLGKPVKAIHWAQQPPSGNTSLPDHRGSHSSSRGTKVTEMNGAGQSKSLLDRPGRRPVKVLCEDGEEIWADHVIVTSSMGYLKKNEAAMFKPTLPEKFRNAIQQMGFGTVGKIFLIWDDLDEVLDPEVEGFQFLWLDGNLPQPPSDRTARKTQRGGNWYDFLQGFERVASHKGALLTWLAGEEADIMEGLPEQEVKDVLHELIAQFTNNVNLPRPRQIIRSQWHSNPYIQGGYSYIPLHMDPQAHDLLSTPLPSPQVLHLLPHAPSTAFRHLPPNSARFSYATKGALFISAQLSTDAVSALRKVRVLI